MENTNSVVAREKLDQMAVWLSGTVTSAFFHSLERFSCVNVTTEYSDDEDDDEDEEENLSKDTQTKKPQNDLPV